MAGIEKAAGASKKLADAQRATTSGQLKSMESAIESLKLEAFDAVKDDINAIMTDTIAWVRANKEAIGQDFKDGLSWLRENFDAIVTSLKAIATVVAVFWAMEKAITAANIGITPMNDGRLIRVPIPELSEERRKDLVKKVKDLVEEAKISCRHARRDANDMLKKAEKDKDISEDDCKRGLEEIQKVTDGHIKKIDAAMTKKQKEILEV